MSSTYTKYKGEGAIAPPSPFRWSHLANFIFYRRVGAVIRLSRDHLLVDEKTGPAL